MLPAVPVTALLIREYSVITSMLPAVICLPAGTEMFAEYVPVALADVTETSTLNNVNAKVSDAI